MGPDPTPAGERWLDKHAGPLVRPYVLTRGQRLSRYSFDVISLVVATRLEIAPAAAQTLNPEQHAIEHLCTEAPLAIVDIAAELDLPVGIVRFLIGDLRDKGVVDVQEPTPESDLLDKRMYEAVLNGLQAL
jgi:hypothetical protein